MIKERYPLGTSTSNKKLIKRIEAVKAKKYDLIQLVELGLLRAESEIKQVEDYEKTKGV